jgi:hypothetical protein
MRGLFYWRVRNIIAWNHGEGKNLNLVKKLGKSEDCRLWHMILCN